MSQEEISKIVESFNGKALNFNVIVKQIENKNETESGLDITSAVDKNEKFRKGVVVSVGEQCPENGIKPGDIILFDNYKTSPLTLNVIDYKIMYYSDLIMVM